MWKTARLVVEVDGRHHMDAAQYWADMDRDNDLTVDGYRVLRFPAFLMRYHPRLRSAKDSCRAAPGRGESRSWPDQDWVSWPGYVRLNHRPPAQARRGGKPRRHRLRAAAWLSPVRERPRDGQRRGGLLRGPAGGGPVLLPARAGPGDRAPGGGAARARYRDRRPADRVVEPFRGHEVRRR